MTKAIVYVVAGLLIALLLPFIPGVGEFVTNNPKATAAILVVSFGVLVWYQHNTQKDALSKPDVQKFFEEMLREIHSTLGQNISRQPPTLVPPTGGNADPLVITTNGLNQVSQIVLQVKDDTDNLANKLTGANMIMEAVLAQPTPAGKEQIKYLVKQLATEVDRYRASVVTANHRFSQAFKQTTYDLHTIVNADTMRTVSTHEFRRFLEQLRSIEEGANRAKQQLGIMTQAMQQFPNVNQPLTNVVQATIGELRQFVEHIAQTAVMMGHVRKIGEKLV